jgi:hypothetical protein
VPIRARLHAVEHHARHGLDLMHLAGGEDDGLGAAEPTRGAAVVEDALALDDVVDLVGARMAMGRRDLSRLPAGDADVRVRRARQRLVDVVRRREFLGGLQIDDLP